MTAAVSLHENWPPALLGRILAILLLLPALLAAGTLENPLKESALPDSDTYRSPLSETLLESNRWRLPQEEQRDWRLPPPPPPLGWRTRESSKPDSGSSTRTIEIFPRYQPGQPSNFDMMERDEKPLIKMFEFGSP